MPQHTTLDPLELANSAYFSFGSPVGSVHQAVSLIGATHVRDIALATSVTSYFRDVPPDLIQLEDFWRHSLAVGIGSRMLAGIRREANVERFFVSGMLHGVGRLVLYISAPDAARSVLEHANERECLLYEFEMELAGLDADEPNGRQLPPLRALSADDICSFIRIWSKAAVRACSLSVRLPRNRSAAILHPSRSPATAASSSAKRIRARPRGTSSTSVQPRASFTCSAIGLSAGTRANATRWIVMASSGSAIQHALGGVIPAPSYGSQKFSPANGPLEDGTNHTWSMCSV